MTFCNSTLPGEHKLASVMPLEPEQTISSDPPSDAIWILSSTFIVFTMQSGFGLLESGSVSVKNELNIMVKNAVDVIFGGLTYWAFGYGLSFGEMEPYSNPICGWGEFAVTAEEDRLGWVYSKFFFQASFATTATTIVSGAMAERTKLEAYMAFSMLNTFVFCLPAHWVWASNGWLFKMGAVDIAGAGPVHLVGGVTGLVATLMLKPRYGRYSSKRTPKMSSPTNAVLGMFMLWWGWLGFNCGSTFGISGVKWKLAARSAATTLCSSVAGGTSGLMLSYIVKQRRFDVTYMINGLLGSLVAVTASCAVVQPWEALIIGFVGALIANGSCALLNYLKVDDPVGCVGTHAMTGVWSLTAAGLFLRKDSLINALFLENVQNGLFHGGGFQQLGIQLLCAVTICAWSVVTSFICLKLIDLTIGLRVPLLEEIIGADIVEHGIGDVVYNKRTKTLTNIEDGSAVDVSTLGHIDKQVTHRRMSSALGHHVLSNQHHIVDDSLEETPASSKRAKRRPWNWKTLFKQKRLRPQSTHNHAIKVETVNGHVKNNDFLSNLEDITDEDVSKTFDSYVLTVVPEQKQTKMETIEDTDEGYTSYPSYSYLADDAPRPSGHEVTYM